ncbi:hypothetical protein FAZ15_01420 [Sphingobacterium olei]|uniref:Uncharacterized protein n=1 Tax=Sphingobacterium olei TaxID=2571155 RepID=A0A4U0P6A6_9SPHI|nr:hypothetical protein [Sphingobacterium olei]TJZ62986.1 hypothetical protein FAZ15_01420 [Sphingobacterium olei]
MSNFNIKSQLLSCVVIITTFSCCASDPKTVDPIDVIHYNITIAPDLSNRVNKKLYPKPVADSDIISGIVDHFYPGVVTYNLANHTAKTRKTGQRDILRVDFINQKLIGQYGINVLDMQLDLKRFGIHQEDRIKYLTNQSNENLATDKTKFKEAYNKMSETAEMAPAGADIWSYFKDGIKHGLVDKSIDSVLLKNGHIKRDYTCNVLLLLTDGYIEAGLHGKDHCRGNKCYFMSSKTVENFRKAFQQSKSKDMGAFFKENGYGIIPAENPLLKDLHVVVLEMYDRSKDHKGGATMHPSDWDILKLFWSDWLTQSGVKSFQLLPLATSKDEAHSNIRTFLESR